MTTPSTTLSANTGAALRVGCRRPFDLLAPENEYLDPNPDIHTLFLEYNGLFFDGKLAGCEVKWSTRMTLCAGICSFQPRSGFCSIRLSEPLLKLRPRSDLVNTLLHEMIHAFIFVSSPVRDHEDHGPIFQSHMARINQVAGTSITVFHTFHDEVDAYRQHWWQCDGPCRQRKPFFGLVKRAMNRPPGPIDRWWAEHQRSCGGTYKKIKEPPGYKEKQERRQKKQKKPPSVKDYFPPASNKGPEHPSSALPASGSSEGAFNAEGSSSSPREGNSSHSKLPPPPVLDESRIDAPGFDTFPLYPGAGCTVVAGEDGEFFLVGDVSAVLQNVTTSTGSRISEGIVDLTASDDEDPPQRIPSRPTRIVHASPPEIIEID